MGLGYQAETQEPSVQPPHSSDVSIGFSLRAFAVIGSRRDQVAYDRCIRAFMELQDCALDVCVFMGYPLVLTKMLEPRRSEENLDHLFGILGVLEYSPPIAAITPTFG